MDKKLLFKKYIFRLFHILGIINLGGFYMLSLFNKSLLEKWSYKSLFLAINISFLIIGGFVNIFLLKNFKNDWNLFHYKLWFSLLHIKFLLTIIIYSGFLKLFLNKEIDYYIKIIFNVFFIIISPGIKLIREMSIKIKKE